MDEQLKKEIRKNALQNAVEHDGKTHEKIVLSKILGSNPELRSKVKEIISEISSIVADVNKISLGEQKSEIQNNFPEILAQKVKVPEERKGLPPLVDAQSGKVVTRFPPEPNGYPHIGHAKAAIINQEYAKMYQGKIILRFDDTNPENARLEFYAAIKVGLDWLGINFDQIKNTSDDMELMYDKGLQLISSNKAYVCTCKRDVISKNRTEMKPCKCSILEQPKISERWYKMFEKFKPGEAIVRYRGNMESQNTVMRDPVLFRIIDARHPLLKNKYRVWPSYDFAVAIEDSVDGVTHAFRTKEYELRKELYYSILDSLKMRKPKMQEFSRLEFKGMPVSKRIIKPLIENGKVSWYDDPRLPTLEAMKRRGITPEAIHKFILSLSLTKSDTLAPFDVLESQNRKIVDPQSIRLFMVEKPRKLTIKNLPTKIVELPNHPTKDLGTRNIEIDDTVYISENDIQGLNSGDMIWLMGLGNVTLQSIDNNISGEYVNDSPNNKVKKIQWVPERNFHRLKIIIPKEFMVDDAFVEDSLDEIEVYVEPQYLNLKDRTEIQFVRYGYCKKDSQNQAIYTHK